jgi:hypothetical protein
VLGHFALATEQLAAPNKLAVLAIACELSIGHCWRQGGSFAAIDHKAASGRSVADVIKKPDDQFLLCLRPFDTDDVILPMPRLPLLGSFLSFRPFPVHIEEELFDVADGYRPLIAVGKPGGYRAIPGGLAYRTYLDDSEWQDYVAEKIRRAERIVMLVKDSDGVRWELARVIREGATLKTLFLLDPGVRTSDDWKTLAKMVFHCCKVPVWRHRASSSSLGGLDSSFRVEEWWRL